MTPRAQVLAAYRERGEALWRSDVLLRAYGFDRIEWQAVGAFGLRVQVWRGSRRAARELGPRQLAAARDPLAMRLDCLDEMCAELGGPPARQDLADLASLAAAVVQASREMRDAEHGGFRAGMTIAELEAAAPSSARRTALALLKWRGAVDQLVEAECRARPVPSECDVCRGIAAQALADGKVGYMRCSACLAREAVQARCCSSSHEPRDAACRTFVAGMNGRCVFCDHEASCHPGPGATCEIGSGEGAPQR